MESDSAGAQTTKGRRRVFHWTIAVAFLVLLATGIIIYVPAFAGLASGSWTRFIHRIAAAILVGAPIVYALLNRGAARQWLREAAIWRPDPTPAPQSIHKWRRRHKLLISIGFAVILLTGFIQWPLKGIAPSSVFNVSLFIHDVAFFSAIIVLLYHVYFEFYWWQWKRKYCRQCDYPYCADACPVGAVISGRGDTVERDAQKCNNCRLCMEHCQRNLYYKQAAKQPPADRKGHRA